jgi:hypothetical protein
MGVPYWRWRSTAMLFFTTPLATYVQCSWVEILLGMCLPSNGFWVPSKEYKYVLIDQIIASATPYSNSIAQNPQKPRCWGAVPCLKYHPAIQNSILDVGVARVACPFPL